MLRCKDVVKIVSSSTEELPWSKRIELRLHTMMCRHCARYAAHLSGLSETVRNLILKKTGTDRARVAEIEEQVIKKIAK